MIHLNDFEATIAARNFLLLLLLAKVGWAAPRCIQVACAARPLPQPGA